MLWKQDKRFCQVIFYSGKNPTTRLIYLSYVPPTHEYGTRPFLRWVRSQGQSPHASGKVKNTFDPVGIPLLGAPQAPGNKPTPRGGKSQGDGPLSPEELSSAEAHPAEPPRGMTAYRMQPNNWRGKIRGPTTRRTWQAEMYSFL